MKNLIALLIMLTPFFFTACDDDDGGNTDIILTDVQVNNLFAPADERDQATGEIITVNEFVYFNLDSKSIVAETDDWDIAFKGTNILTNSGVSGSGNGGAVVESGLFEDIVSAPADEAFSVDTDVLLAIPAGSGSGWYNYNPANHLITPIPGRVLIIRTHDGKFAKMEIISYYENAPAEPDAFMDLQDFFTFRYIYREDGGRDFK